MNILDESLDEFGFDNFLKLNQVTRFYVKKILSHAVSKALIEVRNNIQTQKTGNSGSWQDASVDKAIISDILESIEQSQ